MKSAITLVLSIVTLTTAPVFAETPPNQDMNNPVHAELPTHSPLALLYEDSPVLRMGNDVDRRDLTLQVIDAYYNTLLAQKLLGIVEESVKALEAMEHQSHEFYKKGVVPKTDVLWATARLAQARLERRRLQFDTELSCAALSRLLGYSAETRIEVEQTLEYTPNSYNIPGIYEIAAAHRPDMCTAKITNEEVLSMANAAGPVEPVGETFRIDPFTKTKRMTLSEALTKSVETAGRKRSAPMDSASKEEISGARHQLIFNVLQEVKAAYVTMKSSENDIPDALKAVEACTENFRIITNRYGEQVSECLELVEAQRLLVRTQFTYLKSLAVYRINLARLEKAIGILSAQPGNLEDRK